MSSNWQQAYERILDFTESRPEIILDKSGVSIPHDTRDEFYRHFDAVREAFVESHYPALPEDVGILSESYLQVEKEVSQLLKLDGISMPIDLFSFLHSPKNGLMRALYNRLFDLLQGKITPETFAHQAAGELNASAADLMRLGYETWVALTFVKLLEPDMAFKVDLDSEDKTIPTELKDISFGRQTPHLTLRLPEFIVHSKRINKYIAIKLQLATEIATYSTTYLQPSGKRRRTGDTSFALDSRVMLISVMTKPEEIPITADLEKQAVSKPDLVIECLGANELGDPSALEQVKYRHDVFQPTLGTYLISRDTMRAVNLPDHCEGIYPLAAGFDPSKLQSIISRLAEKLACRDSI